MFPWKFEKNHFFCRDPIVGSKGSIKHMFLEFSKKPLVASPCVDRGKNNQRDAAFLIDIPQFAHPQGWGVLFAQGKLFQETIRNPVVSFN